MNFVADNSHCVETEYSCRYHYKRNSYGPEYACNAQDPDVCRIQLRPKSQSWPTLDFEMPRQRHELDKVEQMMGLAYKRGLLDKMREISNTLKTVIGL